MTIADFLRGGEDDHEFDGGNGNDALDASLGFNFLVGGSGADRLNSGAGDDWLEGGSGCDRFVFEGQFGHDVIMDFDSRNDTIQLDWQLLFKLGTVRLQQDGADFIIKIGDHSSITLQDIGICDLRLSDFAFG